VNAEIAGIYVINLVTRPERWELFAEGFPSWEKAFNTLPERYPAVSGVSLPGYDEKPWFTSRLSEKRKKSWGGKAGCVLSHRNVIHKAYTQKWDNVLILEDDAYLDSANLQLWLSGLKKCVSELPDDWAVINFCTTIPISPCRLIAEYGGFKIVETCGAFGAVAYLLNGAILEEVLRELPDEKGIWCWVARHKTIDRWFSQNLFRFGKVYLVAPALVGHRSVGSSDISMSASQDWQLDFALKDLRLVKAGFVFETLKRLRRINNTLRNYGAVLRQGVKLLRGL
jgi:hypothetical protein